MAKETKKKRAKKNKAAIRAYLISRGHRRKRVEDAINASDAATVVAGLHGVSAEEYGEIVWRTAKV